MKVFFLVSVALMLSLASTALYATGFVTPYWYEGRNDIGSFNYGVFQVCYKDTGCATWPTMEKDCSDEHRTDKEKAIPYGTGSSEVILSIGLLTLVVSDSIMLWYLLKSRTFFWLKSALESSVSAAFYVVIGTVAFLLARGAVETNEVTLGWSAQLMIAAVVTEVATALFLFIPMYSRNILHVEGDSVSASRVFAEGGSVTTESRRRTAWDSLLGSQKIQQSIAIPREHGVPRSLDSGEPRMKDSPMSEDRLRKMLGDYMQDNMVPSGTGSVYTRHGVGIPNTPVSGFAMSNPGDKATTRNHDVTTTRSHYSERNKRANSDDCPTPVDIVDVHERRLSL